MVNKPLTNFNGGEISPLLDGRVDLEKYHSSCSTCENFLLMPYGGVRRRSGTQWVAYLRDANEAARLLPFRFSTADTYILVFNDSYLRIYSGGASPALVGSEIATPYAAADLFEIQFAQQNDVMYLVHPDHAPRKLSRTSATTFTLAEIEWDWAPMQDQNTDEAVTVAAGATTGTGVTLTGVGTAWTSDLIGSRMRIQHEKMDTEFEVVQSGDGTSGEILVHRNWECTLYASAGAGGGTLQIQRYNVDSAAWEDARQFDNNGSSISVSGFEEEITRYRLKISSSSGAFSAYLRSDADPYGEVEFTAVASATSATVTVKKTLFDTSATYLWQEGAFSDDAGNPRAVAFHEGRLVFGGTAANPQTLWGSVTDDYENFDVGTEDDDSYRHSLAANEHNGIRWMVSERRLIIGTSGGEFVVGSADDSVVITPSNVRARRHSNFGSAAIQGLLVGDSVIYVQRQTRKLREYGYVFERDRYQASDLTVLAEHITGTGIKEIAFQQQRDSVVWAVTNEGELIGMTYEREQGVVGWHRHTTAGLFESVETIYGDGEEDEVWVIVKRTVGSPATTTRWIERLEPTQYQTMKDGDRDDYFYVDAGLKETGSDLTGITLAHLEDEEVNILADGIQQPAAIVSGGVASLPSGVTADTIIAGLPMTSRLEPMKLDVPLANGTARSREARVHRIGISVYQSLGGSFGEDADATVNAENFDPILYRSTDDDYDAGPSIRTGDFELDADFDFREGATIGIVSDSVYPLTVLMLVAKMEIYGDR